MRKLRKVLCVILAVMLFVCTLACNVFATSVEIEDNAEEFNTENYQPVPFAEYGATNWTSLGAAKSYYGTDLSYYSCYHFYNGSTYNYYCIFNDGSRLYFGVI